MTQVEAAQGGPAREPHAVQVAERAEEPLLERAQRFGLMWTVG